MASTLENWAAYSDSGRLGGNIYGDERFTDGTWVLTTPVAAGSVSKGETVKTRSGTEYVLGEPRTA